MTLNLPDDQIGDMKFYKLRTIVLGRNLQKAMFYILALIKLGEAMRTTALFIAHFAEAYHRGHDKPARS